MADTRRFELFADLLVAEFPLAGRVYDVAGGLGRLNQALGVRGRSCTTFDRRHKHLKVCFAEREFTLDEPCAADLVVGLHPDAATRLIMAYAARHGIPFAVVPCCSDNSMSYKPWMRFLHAYAQGLGLQTTEAALPMPGRARVILGRHHIASPASTARGPATPLTGGTESTVEPAIGVTTPPNPT